MIPLVYTENPATGETWICKQDNTPIMYFDPNGKCHVTGDVVAFSTIPPLPNTDDCNDENIVTNFMREVDDLIYDYCDEDTRCQHSKVYGVTNCSDSRLIHMLQYMNNRNICLPEARRNMLADAINKFASHVSMNGEQYKIPNCGTLQLKVPLQKLVECAHELRNQP